MEHKLPSGHRVCRPGVFRPSYIKRMDSLATNQSFGFGCLHPKSLVSVLLFRLDFRLLLLVVLCQSKMLIH
jgi:hypothetical protein